MRYAKGEIRAIRFWPDSILKEPSENVPEECFKLLKKEKAWLRQLVSDLVTTMYATGGIGLSAIQIGEKSRVFVCDVLANAPSKADGPKSNLLVAINPEVVLIGDEKVRMVEGCLSFPNVSESVERHASCRLRARTLKGEPYEVYASGILGRIIQHEYDHLDGIVFTERMGTMAKRYASKAMKKLRRQVMRG
jgi:peptide deformylase